MYPNFEIHFLYQEQKYEDLIRQIQLENEARRAYSDERRANGRRSRNLRSRLASITTGLSPIFHIFNRRNAEAGQPDPVSDPCPAV